MRRAELETGYDATEGGEKDAGIRCDCTITYTMPRGFVYKASISRELTGVV